MAILGNEIHRREERAQKAIERQQRKEEKEARDAAIQTGIVTNDRMFTIFFDIVRLVGVLKKTTDPAALGVNVGTSTFSPYGLYCRFKSYWTFVRPEEQCPTAKIFGLAMDQPKFLGPRNNEGRWLGWALN